MSQELLFEINDKIATITLNRPEKLNAFTNDMIDGYYKALLECRDSDAISVVVLTGAGRAFCAGGDVGGMGADGEDENKPLNAKNRLWHHIQRIPKTLIELDKPIIAAVNGVAVGAGMDLAQMCDMDRGRQCALCRKLCEAGNRTGCRRFLLPAPPRRTGQGY